MKNPSSPKERNLIKGALRRVFSRSELRRRVLEKHRVEHFDPKRPRVKKWSWCGQCGVVFPEYLAEVDHKVPLIETDKTLEDYTWTEVVDRMWCDEENLWVLDFTCHKIKSKLESEERRKFKKERDNKNGH